MTPLRLRMLEDMRVRHLSPHTQRAYTENVARFARYFGRSPAELGPDAVRTYQIYLVDERHVAPSSASPSVPGASSIRSRSSSRGRSTT